MKRRIPFYGGPLDGLDAPADAPYEYRVPFVPRISFMDDDGALKSGITFDRYIITQIVENGRLRTVYLWQDSFESMAR